MSHLSTPSGHVTVRVFTDGVEVQKALRFSSLDSAINFFGWYKLREGNGGGFILTPNTRDLVEAGIMPAFTALNFYAMDGSHIEPAVVSMAADVIGEEERARPWPFRSTFPFYEEMPYRFRNGPVPRLHRGFRGRSRWLRSPKTAQEMRENNFANFDEDLQEVCLKVNRRRKYPSLPSRRDDIRRQDQVGSWKNSRQQQWRAK